MKTESKPLETVALFVFGVPRHARSQGSSWCWKAEEGWAAFEVEQDIAKAPSAAR
jgi:hypothetical protein